MFFRSQLFVNLDQRYFVDGVDSAGKCVDDVDSAGMCVDGVDSAGKCDGGFDFLRCKFHFGNVLFDQICFNHNLHT